MILVEDEHQQALAISTLVQHRLGWTVEVVETEFDFREAMSDWILRPPDVFVIDGILKWVHPFEGMEAPPEDVLEGGDYRAGVRCANLVRTELPDRVRVAILTVLANDRVAGKAPNVKYFRKKDDPVRLIRWLGED